MVLDAILLGGVLLGFALLVLAHLALAFKLTVARPHWRGLVALVVPPFAPLWGYRAGYTRWVWAWVGAVVIYGVARVGAEIVK